MLITGCAGFIGSHFTELMLQKGFNVIGVDKLSYASNLTVLKAFQSHPDFTFIQSDICHLDCLYDVSAVFNFAAESHVQNSINCSEIFVKSNVEGCRNLLDLIRSSVCNVKFYHISTDEVYGDRISGSFSEDSLLNPSNPYAASKAAADLFVNSYIRTYGIDAVVFRPTNNYGVRQYYEKLIPLTVNSFLKSLPVPLHDRGEPIRTWLNVLDTCDAIFKVYETNLSGIFNINGAEEHSNYKTVSLIHDILKRNFLLKPFSDLIDLDHVRPGQDLRYSVDDIKLRSATGWSPTRSFDQHLCDIVNETAQQFL